jgi:hypothetical protein
VDTCDHLVSSLIFTHLCQYEYHYVLVKNQKEDEPELVSRVEHHQRLCEKLLWTPQVDAKSGRKMLPQKCEQWIDYWPSDVEPISKRQTLEGGGPKRFVPLEPVTGVYMFWHSARRLLTDPREGPYVIGNQYFHEIMELCDLYLRLCQCTKPSQVYEVKVPDCYKETIPPRPQERQEVARMTHRNYEIEQMSTIKIWYKSYKSYYTDGNEEALQEARKVLRVHQETEHGKMAAEPQYSKTSIVSRSSDVSVSNSVPPAFNKANSKRVSVAQSGFSWKTGEGSSRTSPPATYIDKISPAISDTNDKDGYGGNGNGSETILDELSERITFLILKKRYQFMSW